MNANTIVKRITIATLGSLALLAGAAKADPGYFEFRVGTYGAPYGYQYQGQHRHGPHYPGYYHPGYQIHPGKVIDARQNFQWTRIREGIRSGRLTPHEAARLMREQRDIAQMERHFLGDGYLTQRERERLAWELDQASGQIWREKNDPQSRYEWGPYYNR